MSKKAEYLTKWMVNVRLTGQDIKQLCCNLQKNIFKSYKQTSMSVCHFLCLMMLHNVKLELHI